MVAQIYEVEIKSLLGSAERAEEVRAAMQRIDPLCKLESKHKQLNHYFKGDSLAELANVIAAQLQPEAAARLSNLAKRAKNFSLRTRLTTRADIGNTVYLVVKASVGDDSSANGIARIEFEEILPLTIRKLDSLIISSGFSYEAKWSREREEYICKGITVTLDKNAGYGWLAEFERTVRTEEELEEARRHIRALMQDLNVEELSQERLERMFAYYNAHWTRYYGTDKVFVVE